MHLLENDLIKLSIDEKGCLQELTNLKNGCNYAGGLGLWRLIYQHEEVLEEEITSEDCIPEISQTTDVLTIKYAFISSEAGTEAFALTITARLKNDEVHFDAKLANNSDEAVIREFQFPFVKNINLQSDQNFYWSLLGGQRIKDINGEINKHHTRYIGQDNKAVEMSLLYPGFGATNCFAFANEDAGLYFGSHDTTFQNTLHLLRKRKDEIDPCMVKYPFLRPGEKLQQSGYVLSPYVGNWHVAAKKYRNWTDSWFQVNDKPKSILNSNGWHRIIFRHQYGKIIFRHDQMPEILKSGLEANIDTLFMFGWTKEGHDAGEPEYNFDESQGGHDALKQHIKEFREGGGKVIIYYNGQLINTDTEFYRIKGKKISVKNMDGSEHMEWYPFGGDGTALRQFGNKSFVTACPGCNEWLEHLKLLIDRAIDLEVDGVFFDQMGWTSRPCFDKSHGHPTPFMTAVAAKAEMLRQMREYIKFQRPEMSFGIEWLSDLTAQHVDFIHNIVGSTEAVNDWEKLGEKPDIPLFPEWFRYIFPEVITTDRDIRDDIDIERRVNMALLRGFRSDVEIYRCRAIIDETPHYKAYLAKANQLRDKYRDIILNGTFQDTDGFILSNRELFASAFTSGNRMAVLLTQSHKLKIETKLQVPGYRYLEHDGLNNIKVSGSGDTLDVQLNKHGLIVIIFKEEV